MKQPVKLLRQNQPHFTSGEANKTYEEHGTKISNVQDSGLNRGKAGQALGQSIGQSVKNHDIAIMTRESVCTDLLV
jgi:hypothetical protein